MFSWRKPQDLNELLARRYYGKAVTLLESQLAAEPTSIFLRQRLADVLELDGQPQRAVDMLFGLADHFAREGFVSKGLAILKKIQRIDPQADISQRLDLLMSQSTSEARVSIPAPRPQPNAAAEDPWDRPPVEADPGRGLQQADVHNDPASVPHFTSELVRSEIWLDDADHRDNFHWSPLFAGFPKRALAKVFAGMHLRVKTPGSIIYTEGEPSGGLFVLASGTARIYQRDPAGRNHQSSILQGGTFFGIDGVLDDGPRQRTVVAATSCELLEIRRRLFSQLAKDHPEIRQRVEHLRDESTAF